MTAVWAGRVVAGARLGDAERTNDGPHVAAELVCFPLPLPLDCRGARETPAWKRLRRDEDKAPVALDDASGLDEIVEGLAEGRHAHAALGA